MASALLTKQSDTAPVRVIVDDAKRLREIRALVAANNRSELSDDLIICQIYMESRFDARATAEVGSARGLMQLQTNAVKELYRVENLKMPRAERAPEQIALSRGERLHESDAIFDEATNIQLGTRYMQLWIDRARDKGFVDTISEAYKRYRGISNGVYYRKIKAASERLAEDPESMQILREMVK